MRRPGQSLLSGSSRATPANSGCVSPTWQQCRVTTTKGARLLTNNLLLQPAGMKRRNEAAENPEWRSRRAAPLMHSCTRGLHKKNLKSNAHPLLRVVQFPFLSPPMQSSHRHRPPPPPLPLISGTGGQQIALPTLWLWSDKLAARRRRAVEECL